MKKNVGVRPAIPSAVPQTGPRLRNSLDPQPLDPTTFPHQGRYGRLPGTIPNLAHMLDSYGVSVRYDVIRKRLIVQSALWTSPPDNSDNIALTNIVSLACLNQLPRNDIEAFVAAIADSNPYNPVEEWILSKPWDGIDRLPTMCATLTQTEDYPVELKNLLMRKWLLSAVAAARSKSGFRCRGVLTLQGAQGLGKTTWVSSLVPDRTLRDAVVKIDHHLDATNKDSILGAVCHWICEIGEVESSMKKEVARLKGVITRDSDKVRKPYARAESEMPRRTVFAATVNQAKFLVDDSGNSRWFVIPVTAVKYEHNIDMQQVFAQLNVEFDAGEPWWLSAEEEAQLDAQNRPHRTISAVEDLLLGAFDLTLVGQPNLLAMTPRELLVFLGIRDPHNAQCKECAGTLRTYLGEPKRIQGRDKWRIPLAPDAPAGGMPVHSHGPDKFD